MTGAHRWQLTVDCTRAWKTAAAVRNPDAPVHHSGVGEGQRILLLQVPEPKQVKNR